MNRSQGQYTSSGGSSFGDRFSDGAARNRQSEPSVSAADSRLLDAAQTLVTLQQTSGASNTGLSLQRRPGQQIVHVHKRGSDNQYSDERDGKHGLGNVRMPPPATISTSGGSITTLQPMGPPPPPSNLNARYVVLQANSKNPAQRSQGTNEDYGAMKPPTLPPPSRRGRGSKRGSSSGTPPSSFPNTSTPTPPSGRGRGRGRGRGAKAAAAAQQIQVPTSLHQSGDIEELDDGDLGENEGLTTQAEEEEKRRKKNGATFQVGNLVVRNDIFDELLNDRKLELLLDPEVLSVLEKHKSKPSTRVRTLSNSGTSFMN